MTGGESDTIKIGVSGHQTLSQETKRMVEREIAQILSSQSRAVVAICSLAVGADQIFASCAVDQGLELRVIIPCTEYESTFDNSSDLDHYKALLARANDRQLLDFDEPSEEAFYAAGKVVARESDLLIAVWDGEKAAGLGGTADIVRFAHELGKDTHVVWPPGASRE